MSLFSLKSYRLRTILISSIVGVILVFGFILFLLIKFLFTEVKDTAVHQMAYIFSKTFNDKLSELIYSSENLIINTENLFGKIEKSDPAKLLQIIEDQLLSNPILGAVSYTEEETGYTLVVVPPKQEVFTLHKQKNRSLKATKFLPENITILESSPNDDKKTFTLRMYKFGEFRKNPFFINNNFTFDFRTQPWYLKGKTIDIEAKGEWTEIYNLKTLYIETEIAPQNTIAYASGLFDVNKKFFGVLALDIGSYWINNYLKECINDCFARKFAKAFIFELRTDGSQVVIGHSDSEASFPCDSNGKIISLCNPSQMKDTAISALIQSLPDTLYNHSDSSDYQIFYFDHDNITFMASGCNLVLGQKPWWVLCLYCPENELYVRLIFISKVVIACVFFVLIVGVAISVYIAQKTSKPLEGLAIFAEKIGRLDFDYKISSESKITEINNLSDSMRLMQIGLRSFTRYLPKEVLKSFLDSGIEARVNVIEKDLTILFTDIVNFTSYAEKLNPNELVLQLNELLACFTSAIYKNEGTVDKYIGDAVMAFWNAPKSVESHAFKACKAAFEGLTNLSALQKEWAKLNKPIFKVRVGINTGPVIIGNIGTEERLSYTVIGDNVNLASRLEGLNKMYGTTIIISDFTLKSCGNRLVTRPVDLVGVKGRDQKIWVHELLGIVGETSENIIKFCSGFNNAYEAYLKKDWSGGLSLFQKIAIDYPDDKLTQIYVDRCKEYQQNPPDASWDGGQAMDQK